MSQKLLIGGVLVLVLVGILFWWVSDSDPASPTATRTTSESEAVATTDTTETPDEPETAPDAPAEGSLRDLITRGEALECTFSFADDSGVSGEGTGYFAGDERMRMETTVTEDGQTMTANYVIEDDVMYMWGDSAQGQFAMQMPFTEAETDTPYSEQVPVDVDEDVNYQCESWALDASVFTVPQDREFMDLSVMMQGMSGMEGMSQEDLEAMQEQYGGQ